MSTANPNVQFDIKVPHMIFSAHLSRDFIKVTDFGLSYMKSLPGCDGGSMYQKCGTLHYMGTYVILF